MSSVLPYDILTLCSHAVLLLWRGTERSCGAPCPTDSNFLLRPNSRAASARGRVDASSSHRDLDRGLSPRDGRRVHPHLVSSHAGQVLHLADGRARRPSADNKRAVCVRATPRLHGVASHGRRPSAIGPWARLLYHGVGTVDYHCRTDCCFRKPLLHHICRWHVGQESSGGGYGAQERLRRSMGCLGEGYAIPSHPFRLLGCYALDVRGNDLSTAKAVQRSVMSITNDSQSR